MKKKPCISCTKQKPLDEYYRHPKMADGHLGVCKECHKRRMRMRRLTNSKVQDYDRERNYRPERRAKNNAFTKESSSVNKLATKARRAVMYALKTGRLTKEPCALCGWTKNIHAHHRDYKKPLMVVWLCARCHSRLHAAFPELCDHMVKAQ